MINYPYAEGFQLRLLAALDLLPEIWSRQNVASPGIRPREEKRYEEEPL